MLGSEVDLRGSDESSGSLFSYVDLEARVRNDHPLRAVRLIVNETLEAMERDFAPLYAGLGARRSRPRSFCGRCFCRRSIRCGPNGT